MSASPPHATPSQFDAAQYHPEFGYLAPTIRFRRKAALTLKGLVWGALVGAIATFVVVMDREERALTMLSTPTQVAAVENWAPVLFVPESIAMPAAVLGNPRARSVAPPAVAVAASRPVAPAPVDAAAPARAEVKAVAKPKKKVVHEPPPTKTARAPEPEPRPELRVEPRAAFASPFRPFAEPQDGQFPRPIFGLFGR